MPLRRETRGRWVALASTLLAACAPSGATESGASATPAAAPTHAERESRPDSVLLVTLDTTRADALGCYGGPARTPTIDRLASDGVRFERAYAPVPLTLPSHASLLTGVLPPEHGLRDNGRGALPAEVGTLADAARAAGLATGAFLGATVLDARYGLARGFEVYDDRLPPGRATRGAAEVVDAALAWLAELEGRPFLAWVHFFDPHAPYEPPSEFVRPGQHPYFGEIAWVDSQLARLVALLEAQGRLASTLVIVAADHGESLGEHGEASHGALLFDATLRVPLVLSPAVAAGTVVATPVHLVDVAPTVAELLGWQAAGSSGVSLASALRGAEVPARPLYAESEYCRIQFGWSSLRALVTERWKYVDAPSPRLYDLGADPREERDLAASRPREVERLATELSRLVDSLQRRDAPEVAREAADVRDLEALGYAQSARPARAEGVGGADPHDLVDVIQRYAIVVGLGNAGRFAEMVPPLEDMLAVAPGSAVMHTLLGMAYAETARAADAERELRAALRCDPGSADARLQLGRLFARAGRAAEAEVELRAALALDPGDHRAHSALGGVLAARGDWEGALAAFRAALERKPLEVPYRLDVAEALERTGGWSELVPLLEEGLRHDPTAGNLAVRLARELATSPVAERRDGPRALELARAIVAASGGTEPAYLELLAAAFAETGDYEAAAETARAALGALSEQAPLAHEGLPQPERPRALRERLEAALGGYERREPYRHELGPRLD